MGKKFFKEWIVPILIAYGIAIGINKFLIFTVHIPTGSMIPTINIGDRLVASRVYNHKNIKRGEILVFNFPEKDMLYIKRVIGIPGDKIKIDAGKVFINGEEIKEDYVRYPEVTYSEYEVPEGKYFFLGDNRNDSEDARYWNNPYIDASEIKGRALVRFYPFDNLGKLD